MVQSFSGCPNLINSYEYISYLNRLETKLAFISILSQKQMELIKKNLLYIETIAKGNCTLLPYKIQKNISGTTANRVSQLICSIKLQLARKIFTNVFEYQSIPNWMCSSQENPDLYQFYYDSKEKKLIKDKNRGSFNVIIVVDRANKTGRMLTRSETDVGQELMLPNDYTSAKLLTKTMSWKENQQ